MTARSPTPLAILGVALLALAGVLTLAGMAQAPPAPPAVVVPTATPLPPTATPVPLAATGRALFEAKGCVSCHRHSAVPVGAGAVVNQIGPNLTSYRNDPAFLRRWLADPASVRPANQEVGAMVNLNLTPAEIEAVIAFLNDPGP